MKSATFLALLSVLGAASSVNGKKVSYDGSKAMRIAVGSDVTAVKSLIDTLSLPTWKGVVDGMPQADGYVDLVVPYEKIAAFEELTVDMATQVMHEDLGASIAEESGEVSTYAVGSADITYFNAYHAYADHLQFLTDLVASYPSNAELVVAGNSGQGRPITGIHFYGSGGKGSKPAIVLHGTVHAREWVTGVTAEYLAFNLLSNYATDANIKAYVDKYDFYIFPVVNPDGFVYTQTTERLWRKNRQTRTTSTCVGTDINRNWPYQWSVTGGASTNPCAEDYKGIAQGDTPENTVLRTYLATLAAGKGVKLFIDIHSYSQLFMTPYGYSCSAVATNNAVLQSLAAGVVSAIRAVSGTSYTYGPICSTIYQATGTSVDYVNDVTKSAYTFTIELRDTGTYGFVLPAAQILPTGKETYAGFAYLLKTIT